MNSFLANIGEAVQNSRQAALSGDYATANVFYSAACEQITAFTKANKSAAADWNALKENLLAEQAALVHASTLAGAFGEAATNALCVNMSASRAAKKPSTARRESHFFFRIFFFCNGFFFGRGQRRSQAERAECAEEGAVACGADEQVGE